MSDSWSVMKRSHRQSFDDTEDYEDLNASQKSIESVKTRSTSLPVTNCRDNMRIIEAPTRQETYFEMIRDLGTNLKFNLTFMDLNPGLKEGNSKKAYMLGKAYKISSNGDERQDMLQELKRDYSNVIWFSYRKNFPSLVSDLIPPEESYVSDTSWGCTIRACQMLLAECLRKTLLNKPNKINDKTEIERNNPTEMSRKIIKWFLDHELNPKYSPYSIQMISRYIYKKHETKPGNWLKPSTVVFALQHFHQQYSKYTAQNMQIEIYIEGTIYLNQAVEKVADRSALDQVQEEDFEKEFEIVEDSKEFNDSLPSPLSHQEKIFFHEHHEEVTLEALFEEDAKDVEKYLKIKWKQPLLIVVFAKIGLSKPNPEYLPFIKEILTFPESVGMLGGKPGLAYYIMGHVEDKLIYLDPHFVQESLKSRKDLDDETLFSTYFSSSIRYLSLEDIDTSVGFAFWIKDEVEFERFVKRFKYASKKKESFLCMEANAPQDDPREFENVDCEDEFEKLATK